jgi:DEAD/DEAH box helicase/TIR domain
MQAVNGFAHLGLSDKVLSAISGAGYMGPTPFQTDIIPLVMAGEDVFGVAHPGVGKTIAFILPMLTCLERGRARSRTPRTLILEPTRELATQVEKRFIEYGKNHKLNVALLIGGVSFDEQDRKLQRGVDVLIATPGRLLDYHERGKLLLTGVEIIVIDEADRMLEMGFVPDIVRICKLTASNRQTLLFATTTQTEITNLSEQILNQPVMIVQGEATSHLPVFISYNSTDEKAAVEIGDVIENANYKVFAQYKDMPPGSSFVDQMQSGLANMGKFAPVYSPNYIASDICQDEWNTAYNMDRGAKRRLIIGFLAKPTKLLPLQRQVVHVPLYGLAKEEARDAILDALLTDNQRVSAHQSRRMAAKLATPEPVIELDGRIGVSQSAKAEQQFLDDELALLPSSLRTTISQILAACQDKNVPAIITSPLHDYQTELLANGSAPRIADLDRVAEIVAAELGDAEQDSVGWLRGGLKTALGQFLQLHEELRQHFPIYMLRDFELAKSPIDPKRFDEAALASANIAFTQSVRQAEDEGRATEELRRVAEWRERQRKDIASLRDPAVGPGDMFLTDADRLTPGSIKKRFLFDQSGTTDKLIDHIEKVTSIADSGAGKLMIEAGRHLLKMIWGG